MVLFHTILVLLSSFSFRKGIILADHGSPFKCNWHSLQLTVAPTLSLYTNESVHSIYLDSSRNCTKCEDNVFNDDFNDLRHKDTSDSFTATDISTYLSSQSEEDNETAPSLPYRAELNEVAEMVMEPTANISEYSSVAQDLVSMDIELQSEVTIPIDLSQPFSAELDKSSAFKLLLEKYKGRLIQCQSTLNPCCDIYICGTLHVAKTSVDMVREVIRTLRPSFVLLELCEGRVDNLIEHEEPANLTIREVLRNTIAEKSVKTFGMGLLSWMQLKAAKIMGNKLGGELAVAAKEGDTRFHRHSRYQLLIYSFSFIQHMIRER